MTEYRVKGAFFENEKNVGPAFTGFVEIDGVKTSIALWPKRSAKGANYLQVSEDKKKSQEPPANPNSPFRPRIPNQQPNLRASGNDPRDDGDDIPF